MVFVTFLTCDATQAFDERLLDRRQVQNEGLPWWLLLDSGIAATVETDLKSFLVADG